MKNRALSLFISLALAATLQHVRAQGTAFTYQGHLNDSGHPASGFYDLRFAIFDSGNGGNLVGRPLTNCATGVTNGLFTAALDFGAGVFDRSPRWLEIAVRTNGGTGGFATLVPRQALTKPSDLSSTNTLIKLRESAAGVPIVTSGFITGARVTKGGAGYPRPPRVTVTDTTGSGAIITATVSNGIVVGLSVQSAGHNYSTNAALTIRPPPFRSN